MNVVLCPREIKSLSIDILLHLVIINFQSQVTLYKSQLYDFREVLLC